MSSINLIESKGVLRNNWNAEVEDYVIGCEWADEGNILLVGNVAGGVSALEGETGNILWHKSKTHDGNLLAISVNPNGKLFATSGQDGCILIRETAGGAVIETIQLGKGWVEHLEWSQDGISLAASISKNVHVFDYKGQEKWRSEQHSSTISALAWSRNDELATACYGKVAFHDVIRNKINQSLEWKGSLISMELSADGNIVACGSQDNTVHFWRRSTGEDSMMSGYPGKPRNLAFNSSGKLLATGGHEIITVWSFENNGPEGTTPGQLECHESFVSMLSFAPHGNRLASGARDGSIAIWGLMSDGHGGSIGTSRMSDHVSSIAWKKDSKVIAAGNAKGQIVTWKVKT